MTDGLAATKQPGLCASIYVLITLKVLGQASDDRRTNVNEINQVLNGNSRTPCYVYLLGKQKS